MLRRDGDDEAVYLATLNALELCADLPVDIGCNPARANVLNEVPETSPR